LGGSSASSQTAFSSKTIKNNLRNAIAKGNTDRVKKIARNLNLKSRDTKALVAVAQENAPKDFWGRALSDVQSTVENTAKGLPGMAWSLAKSATPIPAIVAAAQGKHVGVEGVASSLPIVGPMVVAPVYGAVTRKEIPTSPFGSQAGQSLRNSYERAIHPTQAVKDYSQRPFSSLVEDVGNVATFLGPAGKAIGAAGEAANVGAETATAAGDTARAAQLAARSARLGTLSQRFGQVSHAADIVSDAPFFPVSLPAKALNLALTGGQLPAESVGRLLPAALRGKTVPGLVGSEKLRPVMDALRISPNMRAVRNILRKSSETRAFTADEIANRFRDQQRILPQPDEQRAMALIGQGQADALAKLRQLIPTNEFDKIIRDPQGPIGRAFTPESVYLATDIVSGRNPELAARVQQALELGRPGRQARAKGYSDRGGQLRQEQFGYQPLTIAMDRATKGLTRRVELIRKQLDRREKAASNVENAVMARAQAVADRTNKTRTVALQRQAQSNMLRNYRVKTLAQIAKLRSDLAVTRSEMRKTGIEYRARRDQYMKALRVDPKYAGMPKLRSEMLDAYKRYSDLLTLRTKLDRSIQQLTRNIPDAPPLVRVPAEMSAEKVMRTMPGAGRASILRTQANATARRVATAERRLAEQAKQTAASVEAAPARLRPILETNRLVNTELHRIGAQYKAAGLPAAQNLWDQAASQIPETLQMLQQNGINVEHFINPNEMRKLGISDTGQLSLPRISRLNESRRRTGKGRGYDMTLSAQGRAEIARANQLIEHQTMQEIAALPFMKRGTDLSMMKDANGEPLFPMMQGPNSQFPTRKELNDAGYEIWDPTNIFGSRPVANAESIIAPKVLVEAFKSYYGPGGLASRTMNTVLRYTLDPMTRAFKIAVLPLSPSWNVGNFITNAFMATFVAGIDPVTLARNIKQAIEIRKQTGEWPGGKRLYSSTSAVETMDFMSGRNREAQSRLGQIATGKFSPVHVGFATNQTVDNMYRAAVYLTKEKKFGSEGAIKMALRAMGDFTNLSPFERNTVRRIIPFYAWLKHMTQVVVRLPIEHPYRTAWILHMSNLFKDQQPWEELLPSFMRGFIPLGSDTTLGVQNFMPFSNPFGITEIQKNLNPFIKLALTNIPGLPTYGQNFLTGRPYTRPPGTGRYNEFGNPTGTPPSLLEQLRQMSPQIRMIDAASGRKNVARYETGDPILVRGANGKLQKIEVPQNPTKWITQFLGVPTSSKKTLKSIADTIIARKVKQWEAANPQKDLSKGGGSWLPHAAPSSNKTSKYLTR
jgi:hypothetical protein